MRIQDAVGTGLSGLCLMHCLALPVLISLSPVFAWFEHEWIHGILAVLALLVSAQASRYWPAGRTGATLRVTACFGVAFLFAGWLLEVSETLERVMTTIGALALAGAHLGAWQAGRVTHAHIDN